MNVHWQATTFSHQLAVQLRLSEPPVKGVEIYWLGQAGFLLRSGTHCVVIDPYLSDSLAEKYRDRPLPHQRMMAAPIQPDMLTMTTHLLVTHHHTDHMDGATLTPLLALATEAELVAPRASLALAAERSRLSGKRLKGINAGEKMCLAPGLTVQAVRASHETLEKDNQGNFRFLGYVIDLDGMRIFHSGDTIPFPGQVDELSALAIDLALLPVNGRSEALHACGVPGNLTLTEALLLCQQCEIRYMIAHHYGLFDFNTADPAAIDAAACSVAMPELLCARLNTRYYFEKRLSAEMNE